jgi:hypothetical protein
VPLVDETFEPDEAAALVEQGLSVTDSGADLLDEFPYLGIPFGGFSNPA